MRNVPEKMKAVFSDPGSGKLVTREVSVPEPARGEVLVKMAAAPVNPSDIARIRRGDYDPASFIPGIEGSGMVIASGGGLLPRLLMGKRVACTSTYAESGTWAEYMVTKAGKCFPLDRRVDYRQGSMSVVNPLTALGFMEIVRKEKHKALINNAAASSLGSMIRHLGMIQKIPVINIVRSDKNMEILKSTGSLYVLNSSSPTFTEDLHKLSHELGATIFFDSTCSPQLSSMINALPHAGSVVIYGNLTGEEFITVNPRDLIDRDIKISGFYLGHMAARNGLLKNLLNMYRVSRLMAGTMKVKINACFPLEKAGEAVGSYLADMSAGKVLLEPASETLSPAAR